MRPTPAVLVKRTTEDGLVNVQDDVPLGRVYIVDMDSLRQATLYNTEKDVEHIKEIVDVLPDLTWFTTELLKIGDV